MLFRNYNDEKRDFFRMGVTCPATLKVMDSGVVYQGMVSNLSASGLQFDGSDELGVGLVVMVEMTPEQVIVPPLQARAEVVRCDRNANGGYQLGLKILEMSPGL